MFCWSEAEQVVIEIEKGRGFGEDGVFFECMESLYFIGLLAVGRKLNNETGRR